MLSCSVVRVRLSVIPQTVVRQAPLSMRFPRQEYWVGCHALLQGIFTTQGLNPSLLHCRWILYHLSIHSGIQALLVKEKDICSAVIEKPCFLLGTLLNGRLAQVSLLFL